MNNKILSKEEFVDELRRGGYNFDGPWPNASEAYFNLLLQLKPNEATYRNGIVDRIIKSLVAKGFDGDDDIVIDLRRLTMPDKIPHNHDWILYSTVFSRKNTEYCEACKCGSTQRRIVMES